MVFPLCLNTALTPSCLFQQSETATAAFLAALRMCPFYPWMYIVMCVRSLSAFFAAGGVICVSRVPNLHPPHDHRDSTKTKTSTHSALWSRSRTHAHQHTGRPQRIELRSNSYNCSFWMCKSILFYSANVGQFATDHCHWTSSIKLKWSHTQTHRTASSQEHNRRIQPLTERLEDEDIDRMREEYIHRERAKERRCV